MDPTRLRDEVDRQDGDNDERRADVAPVLRSNNALDVRSPSVLRVEAERLQKSVGGTRRHHRVAGEYKWLLTVGARLDERKVNEAQIVLVAPLRAVDELIAACAQGARFMQG